MKRRRTFQETLIQYLVIPGNGKVKAIFREGLAKIVHAAQFFGLYGTTRSRRTSDELHFTIENLDKRQTVHTWHINIRHHHIGSRVLQIEFRNQLNSQKWSRFRLISDKLTIKN